MKQRDKNIELFLFALSFALVFLCGCEGIELEKHDGVANTGEGVQSLDYASMAKAFELAVPSVTTFVQNIDNYYSHVYCKIEVAAGTLDIYNESTSSYQNIYLLSESGNYLDFGTDTDEGIPFHHTKAVAAGIYYLELSSIYNYMTLHIGHTP